MATILTVEDDDLVRETIHLVVEGMDYRSISVASKVEGSEVLRSQHVDAILADVHLADGNGVAICRESGHQTYSLLPDNGHRRAIDLR